MKSILHLGRHLGAALILIAVAAVTVAAAPQTNALMTDGNHAYMRGDFAGAAKAYQQALDAEKKQPTLDRPTTITLIDNLGTAYGVTGNWDKRVIRLRRFQVPHASYLLLRYCLHLWPQKRCGECHHLSPEGVCQ